ncbi:MAG: glycine/betaine ABC transporter substrate-binding protein [Clostridia bacterium]|nr:glycine/betaine ABC transporter substrate-binding protein [Clostridia bacterium]
MKKVKRKALVMLVVFALLFVAGYTVSSLAVNGVVRIGHREFAEQRIVGQLLAVYLESKGFQTEVTEYQTTWSIFDALKDGKIDVYTDYTGAIYGVILNQSKALSADETYNYVKTRLEKEYGMTLLKPLGWNNTYVLSVLPETAKKYHLKKISDIIPVANRMILGSDLEFPYRKDGLIGLTETYTGLNFRSTKSMEQSHTYQALMEGRIHINASYSTDGQIKQYDLVNLIDDRGFFPPYYVIPIIKIDYAAQHPEVVAALNALKDQWTEEDITTYNLMVDEGQDPRVIAEQMLRDKGLI